MTDKKALYLKPGRKSSRPDSKKLLDEFEHYPGRILAEKYKVSLSTMTRWLRLSREEVAAHEENND